MQTKTPAFDFSNERKYKIVIGHPEKQDPPVSVSECEAGRLLLQDALGNKRANLTSEDNTILYCSISPEVTTFYFAYRSLSDREDVTELPETCMFCKSDKIIFKKKKDKSSALYHTLKKVGNRTTTAKVANKDHLELYLFNCEVPVCDSCYDVRRRFCQKLKEVKLFDRIQDHIEIYDFISYASKVRSTVPKNQIQKLLVREKKDAKKLDASIELEDSYKRRIAVKTSAPPVAKTLKRKIKEIESDGEVTEESNSDVEVIDLREKKAKIPELKEYIQVLEDGESVVWLGTGPVPEDLKMQAAAFRRVERCLGMEALPVQPDVEQDSPSTPIDAEVQPEESLDQGNSELEQRLEKAEEMTAMRQKAMVFYEKKYKEAENQLEQTKQEATAFRALATELQEKIKILESNNLLLTDTCKNNESKIKEAEDKVRVASQKLCLRDQTLYLQEQQKYNRLKENLDQALKRANEAEENVVLLSQKANTEQKRAVAAEKLLAEKTQALAKMTTKYHENSTITLDAIKDANEWMKDANKWMEEAEILRRQLKEQQAENESLKKQVREAKIEE
jgi:hypothetical protein